MALVVVTWEPVLHAVQSHYARGSWGKIHFNRTTQATTACRQEVTGYIDSEEDHVISCLECLVRCEEAP
jgi:hypothetical protein